MNVKLMSNICVIELKVLNNKLDASSRCNILMAMQTVVTRRRHFSDRSVLIHVGRILCV